jgi:hypothetical protein
MKKLLTLLAFVPQILLAAETPVASGAAKVYEGPEGETISVVEVNDGKQVIAKFEGVKGEVNGTVALLKINDMGSGKQEYVRLKKKGSKTLEIPVMEGGQGRWRFLQPGVDNWLNLKYSKDASSKTSAETLLKQYKP